MNNKAAASPSQAWAILVRHAREEIRPLRLQELCCDNDRVSSLVTVHTSNDNYKNRILIADLSRQRMTLETMNHLLRLASARDVKGYVTQLSWGQNDPNYPIIEKRVKMNDRARPQSTSPSMHLALRVPKNPEYKIVLADGTNALTGIHENWKQIQELSDNIRNGVIRGFTGMLIRDVIVVGNGVSIMALKFIYEALYREKEAKSHTFHTTETSVASISKFKLNPIIQPRKMRFITSLDSLAMVTAIDGLHPGSTMVIAINTDEKSLILAQIKNWLLENHLHKSNNFYPHIIHVTSNEDKLKSTKNAFIIPQHSCCEPFLTFTAAGLLPLSIVFGWKITQSILSGAHDMDLHFTDTNPRHNLPILLALTDVWNTVLLKSSGRMVIPYSDLFTHFGSFVSALESQTCSQKVKEKTSFNPGIVIQGSLHGEYDRILYQGQNVIPCELITVMDPPDKNKLLHNASICSYFAHADVLAFGNLPPSSQLDENDDLQQRRESLSHTDSYASTGMGTNMTFLNNSDIADGNRPSTLLICGTMDAFTCGQLIALSEHRAVVAARLWDVDPFARKVGSSIRDLEIQKLKEALIQVFNHNELNDDNNPNKTNLATSTILSHYANRINNSR